MTIPPVTKIAGAERTLNYETINPQRTQAIARRFVTIKDFSDYYVSRLEVALTENCNLHCTYCNKHNKAGEAEERIDPQVLSDRIREYARHHCRFVHFTGGEPTLVSYLPELVELCHRLGMEVSITTNGIARNAVYVDLLEKGLNTIHVSIDAIDESSFAAITGVKNQFTRLLENIRLFVEYRQRGYKVKVTLNVCVTPEDLDGLREKIEYMIALQSDDIKLMTVSNIKWENWQAKRDLYLTTVLPKIQLLLPPDDKKYVMLRSRLPRLFDQTIRGFHCGPPKRCFLTPEERVIGPDGRYYQCYIYYREGGEPVGNIVPDEFALQSRKLFENAARVPTNGLCSQFCADITYMANRYIGELIETNNV